jgi:hypothetical protein
MLILRVSSGSSNVIAYFDRAINIPPYRSMTNSAAFRTCRYWSRSLREIPDLRPQ